jgi:hypothetical protein
MSARHVRRLAVLAVATAFAGPLAADIVDIRWGLNDEFDRELSIAPGKFAEVCGKLTKGSSVDWRFDGSGPLDFNIHYHAGKDVVFPAKADAVASSSGALSVEVDQDYCWMWRNKTGAAVSLRIALRRRI